MESFGRLKSYPFIYLAILLPVIGLFTTGCIGKNKPAASEASISVTDFRGKEIALAEPANRVICLIESALSGIYMLNAQEYVVGVPSDVYRGSVAKRYASLDNRLANGLLPSPGNWDFISIEQIIVLQPDLVIIWASQTEAINNIEQFGIPVYAVMMHSIEDVYKEITDFGTLFNRTERADSLISFTKNNINHISQLNKKDKPARGYFMWAQGINHTSGKNSTVNQMFEFAGIENVVESDMEHLTVNIEKILEWNPEIIIMWNNDKLKPEDVISHPILKNTTAAKSGNVFMLPDVFDCDLWTLKMQHAVKLVSNWAYGESFNQEEELEKLMEVLY